MLEKNDVQARLRLFRYGLLVVVIITFLVSLLAPMLYLNALQGSGLQAPPLTDFLGNALLFTIIVGVIALLAYGGYHYFLTKTWPMMGNKP